MGNYKLEVVKLVSSLVGHQPMSDEELYCIDITISYIDWTTTSSPSCPIVSSCFVSYLFAFYVLSLFVASLMEWQPPRPPPALDAEFLQRKWSSFLGSALLGFYLETSAATEVQLDLAAGRGVWFRPRHMIQTCAQEVLMKDSLS